MSSRRASSRASPLVLLYLARLTLKTLYLKNTGGVGDRVLDISIQSRSPVAQDTSEVLRTLFVPTIAPMKVEYGVKYLHARRDVAWIDGLAYIREQLLG
jgi:hypothetical protein